MSLRQERVDLTVIRLPLAGQLMPDFAWGKPVARPKGFGEIGVSGVAQPIADFGKRRIGLTDQGIGQSKSLFPKPTKHGLTGEGLKNLVESAPIGAQQSGQAFKTGGIGHSITKNLLCRCE